MNYVCALCIWHGYRANEAKFVFRYCLRKRGSNNNLFDMFFILKLNTALDPNLYETCRLVEKMVRSIRRTSTIIHTTLSTYLLTYGADERALVVLGWVHSLCVEVLDFLPTFSSQATLALDRLLCRDTVSLFFSTQAWPFPQIMSFPPPPPLPFTFIAAQKKKSALA